MGLKKQTVQPGPACPEAALAGSGGLAVPRQPLPTLVPAAEQEQPLCSAHEQGRGSGGDPAFCGAEHSSTVPWEAGTVTSGDALGW